VIGRSRSTLRYDRDTDPTSRPWSGDQNVWPGDTPDSDTGESTRCWIVGAGCESQAGSSALDRAGLKRPMRRKKPRKLGARPASGATVASRNRPDSRTMVWTCDFIHDRTAGGRSLKWLTLVDEYTRECLVLHAAGSMTGADVRRIMARVVGRRGSPTNPERQRVGVHLRGPDELVEGWSVPSQFRWRQGARGRTVTSSRSTAGCETSSWSVWSSRGWRTLDPRRHVPEEYNTIRPHKFDRLQDAERIQ